MNKKVSCREMVHCKRHSILGQFFDLSLLRIAGVWAAIAKGRHSEVWTKIHVDRCVIALYIHIHQGARISRVI